MTIVGQKGLQRPGGPFIALVTWLALLTVADPSHVPAQGLNRKGTAYQLTLGAFQTTGSVVRGCGW